MEIDFEKLKVKREYIFGMTMDNGAERQHKYTIDYDSSPLHEMVFNSATWTPKRKGACGKWGNGTTEYFHSKSKESFKTAIECVKDLYNHVTGAV